MAKTFQIVVVVASVWPTLAAFASSGPSPVSAKDSSPSIHSEPRIARERIVLHTSAGDLVLALYPDVAPKHVAQIEKMVKLGIYDGVHFYRVEPGFLVQLSDGRDRLEPLTPEQEAAIHPIKAEFSGLKHLRGTLTMARRDDDVDSATTSFSILLAAAPHLDDKYTIFGRLEKGYDVIDAMALRPIDPQHRPLDRIGLNKAEIVDASKVASVLRPTPAPPAPTKSEEMPQAWLALVLTMMAAGLAIFFTAGKVPTTATACLGMFVVLVGYFLLFLALAPRARENSALAVALFAGSVAVFKAMSYFERAR